MPKPLFKSLEEMERIREGQAVLDQKRLATQIPEANESKPVGYFEVFRYTKGSFRGLFGGAVMITEDAKGHPLKKPIRKIVADGVDMVVLMSSLETALRRKVFR